ncbi:MAG: hypothetical protein CL868_03035 [Cytophagaceae bacterium]|nr:hypothetical protein [Cytophagaceae bacterium]|tara:strand:+ start:991 stop:1428 length:438 start_codon:yes stop_codon:yes gene_type:complete
MELTSTTKPPTTFWVISIVALVWNLIGLLQFVSQMMITPEMIEMLPEAQQEAISNIPLWVMIGFGVATIGGTLGSIGLLMRKKWAKSLFIISLLGFIVQSLYNLVISDNIELLGANVAAFAGLIMLVCLFLIWYSSSAIKKGWLR